MNEKVIKTRKIGYQLGASFEDLGAKECVGFEILFPHIYASYEEADASNGNIHANMEKLDNEIVICLYENQDLVETIHWDEWWKYKCNRVKEECKNLAFLDGNTDYEPYCATFEEIFEDYCSGKEREKWNMQYLAYWIEPVLHN